MANRKEAIEALKKSTSNGSGKELVPTLQGNSQQIEAVLRKYQAQVSQILPRRIDPVRFLGICTTIIASSPDLKKCTPSSVIGSILNASILGLDLTPQLGQVYLIKYENYDKTKKKKVPECQFQIGYQGYISLMTRNSKDTYNPVLSIEADVVYERDHFVYEKGINQKLEHIPEFSGDRGLKLGAYAIIRFEKGDPKILFMSAKEIFKIRDDRSKGYSPDSKYSPWNTDEDEMMKKTVIKRIRKTVPLPQEQAFKLATDESIIEVEDFDASTGELDLARVDSVHNADEDIPEKTEEIKQEETKNEDKDKDQGKNQTKEVTEVTKIDMEALVMYANQMDDDERKKFLEFWNDAEARWIDAPYWFERLKHLKDEAEKKKK